MQGIRSLYPGSWTAVADPSEFPSAIPETWRQHPDFRIQLSSRGRARTEDGSIIPLQRSGLPNKDGRHYIQVHVPGKGPEHLSRLIWRTFFYWIPDGHHVDHIDFNPENNHLWNLQLLTAAENCRRQRGRRRVIRATYDDTTVIRCLVYYHDCGYSVYRICQEQGFPNRTVSRWVKGQCQPARRLLAFLYPTRVAA